MPLTLYHNDMSVCAQKVRLCLAEKQLAYEDKHLNLRAGDQKRPEYLALNPNGYVPTLVHDDFVVIESTVICEYIDDAFPARPLKPADAKARARMRGFTKFIDAAIFPATATVSRRRRLRPPLSFCIVLRWCTMICPVLTMLTRDGANPRFTHSLEHRSPYWLEML